MIRDATVADVPRLVNLGCAFMSESSYADHLSVNKQAMAKLFLMLVRAEHGRLIVDEHEGKIVGMIGVLATFHPHSDDQCLSELLWYVSPAHRGSGVRLLHAAEQWGRTVGARKFLVVSPNSKVSEFYRRCGFARLEEQFIKDL